MFLKKYGFFLFLPFLTALCFGQSCSTGLGVTGTAALVGTSCSTFSTPVGVEVVALNQTAAMASQTICDTSGTCPAGFYVLDIYVEPNVVGTLVSALSVAATYTSDVRTYTNLQMGSNLSLVQTTPLAVHWVFYHAANTAVTVNTTAITFTGSPSYNFRARINLIGSN